VLGKLGWEKKILVTMCQTSFRLAIGLTKMVNLHFETFTTTDVLMSAIRRLTISNIILYYIYFTHRLGPLKSQAQMDV